jgi:hypothetical protein
MKDIQTTMRSWLYWLVPMAALLLLILWQTDWGRAFFRVPPPESTAAPQALTLAMLPEYQPAASLEGSRDVVERTLFNPTRRPAPTAVAEAAKPRMQRGQFTLQGTMMVDGKATAFLRETNGGKSRRVAQGEQINGLVVAEVRPDRVRLALGDETEELALKVAVGPRTTIQPVVSGPGGASVTATGGATPGASAQVRDVAEVLAERRRAARAAEAAAAGLPPGAPIPTAAAPAPAPPSGATASAMPPSTATPGPADPAWAGVYQRYQQPRR